MIFPREGAQSFFPFGVFRVYKDKSISAIALAGSQLKQNPLTVGQSSRCSSGKIFFLASTRWMLILTVCVVGIQAYRGLVEERLSQKKRVFQRSVPSNGFVVGQSFSKCLGIATVLFNSVFMALRHLYGETSFASPKLFSLAYTIN